MGFEVETAADALEGIDKATRLQPSVILMDLDMPGVDGLAAARRLRTDPRTSTIPIILWTSTAVEAEALKAGCKAFMPKPCTKSDLVAALRAQLAPE